ncbi:MAG: bifunctional riboflavin kinase/FAD synthetase [Pseudobdellovibrionaceae bacterium]
MKKSSGSVMTIGNFDGFHLGHRSLMTFLQKKSQSFGLPGYVVTFKPHPIEVLYPARKFERLFDEKDQEEQISQFPPLALKIIQFDEQFSKQSPTEFLNFLCDQFQPKAFVVGHDFMFGHKKSGDHDLLKSYCLDHHIDLQIMPAITLEGKIVSSSKIRDELKLGGIEFANRMLGRSFYLEGTVVHGRKLGRTLGIPTANLNVSSSFVPRYGVYLSRVFIQNNQNFKCLYAVTNIGVNPTVSEENKAKVENHIFDFASDIYGQNLRVELLKYIRNEKKFDSVDDLKVQIGRDLAEAKQHISIIEESQKELRGK